MKIKICSICATVSLTWLALSAGVAWGYFTPETYLIPIALLMGGTVAGIAYLGEKLFPWAIRHSQAWKIMVILVGMSVAYLFVVNITKLAVALELIIILILAYFFFIKRPLKRENKSENTRKIEEQIDQCC